MAKNIKLKSISCFLNITKTKAHTKNDRQFKCTMIQEPKNNFDEHIREALEGFEMPFESNDWALMEQKLNREDSKAGFVLFFSNKYLQLGVAAALLVCVLYNVGQWSQDANTGLAMQNTSPTHTLSNSLEQTAITQDLNKETVAIDAENVATNDVTKTAITKQKDLFGADEKALTTASLSNSKTQNAALFDISPAKTQNTITAYDKKSTLNSSNKNGHLNKKENVEQFATATIPTFNKHQNTLFTKNITHQTANLSTMTNAADVLDDRNVLPPNDANVLLKSELANNIILPLAHKNVNLVEKNEDILLVAKETAQPLTDFSSLIEMPKVPRKKSDIAVGLHLASDVNFVDANWTEAGFSTGVSLNIGKNKRWGLQTGAFYSYKNFATSKFGEFATEERNAALNYNPTNYSSDMALHSTGTSVEQQNHYFNIEAFFIEIPLLLTHNFSPNGQFNPYISAGTSIWIPTSLQKTSYSEQITASYDYASVLQNLNDRNNATPSINARNPDFIVTDITSISEDTLLMPTTTTFDPDYINTIPEYFTAVNETGVNETVGKSRAYWDILQVQAGLDIELSKRWSFQLAGQVKGSIFKHALNRDAIQNLSSVDKRLHTIGVQLGVTCTL